MNKTLVLVRAWLQLDFFGDARRAGSNQSSSLTTTIFAQSFLAFVFAAVLYPETPPVPFAAANLCLSSLLVAIGALGDESRPARRAADDILLATTPVSRATVALARAGHAAFYVLLVTIGMALPPAVLLGCWHGSALPAVGYVAAACACSGLAAGALGVIARAASRWLGGGRTALLLGTLKALALGGGLVLFALGLQKVQATAEALPIGRLGAELLPPYHAARWLAAPAAESWRLLPFVGGAALLLLLALLLGGRAAAPRNRVGSGGPARWLLHRLCGGGPRLGVAEFVAVSMWRSPGFRARVLPLLGMPAGMALLTLRSGEREHDYVLLCLLLQLPAIYLPFLIAFLPRADQPGTGWVFAQAPTLPRELVHDATWRALVSHVLLPVQALAVALMWLVGREPLQATAAALFATGVGVLVAQVMVRTMTAVPFTADQEGDSQAELGGAFGGALVLGGIGTAFGILLPAVARWPVALAVLAVAILQLRRSPPAPAAAVEPSALAEVEVAAQTVAKKRVQPGMPSPAPTSLGRELRAIAVLYAAVCILPLLVGTLAN